MIDSYTFGKITINGIAYTSDVVIHHDHVKGEWWRKSGHFLNIDDIKDFIEKDRPHTLIVGTGKYGRLKINPETKDYLEDLGIELIALNTDDACETFNRIYKKGKVIGALHLSC